VGYSGKVYREPSRCNCLTRKDRPIMFFYDKKDYEITKRGDWHIVSRPDSYQPGKRCDIARFHNVDSAIRFIARYTEPRTYTGSYWDDSCRCGSVSEGWDFVKIGESVIELCNKCQRPLYQDDYKALNKKALDDFDLDAFINS
jgi:hypothetical protein